MAKRDFQMNDVVTESKDITLVEILDRTLNKGVVLNGDLTISVADVDLIFVGVRVLLASVETAEKMCYGYKSGIGDGRNNGESAAETFVPYGSIEEDVIPAELVPAGLKQGAGIQTPSPRKRGAIHQGIGFPSSRKTMDSRLNRNDRLEVFSEKTINELEEIKAVLPKIDDDPKKVEHGLARLALTLIELIRKLMEKQAIRRMDSGTLSDKEVERLGDTFMRLENKMEELKKVFGLSDEDLNLNLGPLGDLM
jgi:hypothetical protein